MDFSEARAGAIAAAESQSSQGAPQAAPEITPQMAPETSAEQAPSTAQQLQDISKLEKFLLEGKETTWKDLKAERMRYADYTRKTQEISEQRKYINSLPADLAAVKSNPALAEEFKRVYPKEYHAYMDLIVSQQEQPTERTEEENPQTQFDQKRIEQLVNKMVEARVAPVENHFKEERVKAVEAQLDATFKIMGQKYQFANEEAVLARAQAMHNQGYPLNEETWERIFKSVHDDNQKRYDGFYKNKITEQQKVNAKTKDPAPGGGIPGEAPKKTSFKDVQKQMMDDLKSGRLG